MEKRRMKEEREGSNEKEKTEEGWERRETALKNQQRNEKEGEWRGGKGWRGGR